MEPESLREDIAYHEAGHAAACVLFSDVGTDIHMCFLAIENQFTFQGAFIYSLNHRRNKRQQLAQAIINIAGAFATAIYKYDAHAVRQGSGSDFDKFDDFVYKWNAMERRSHIFSFTMEMLKVNWGLVKAIAERLNATDCVYGHEIKEIANGFKYDKEEFETLLSTIKRKTVIA